MYSNSLHAIISWKYLAQLAILIFGLLLIGTGTVCEYRSAMGLDPWNVLQQGISRHTFLSFGTASIVVGAAIILLLLCLKVYPGVGTLLNMTLIGVFVDWQLYLNWLPDLSRQSLLLRLLVDSIGVLLIGIGGAFYMSAHLGAGPRDSVMLELRSITKVRLSVVRTILECSVLLVGFLLEGTVGIGTLIFAIGIGPTVEMGFGVIKRLHFVEAF